MTAATEFADLRTHAPMQWLTLCCWIAGMSCEQTGYSLIIGRETVKTYRTLLRRKGWTPWTVPLKWGTNLPDSTGQDRREAGTGVQRRLATIEPGVFCVCVRCGPPWRDTYPRPDRSDFGRWFAWGSWMALCPRCGSKRCPGAFDHSNDCVI